MKRSIFLGTVSAVFLLFCAGCGDTAASSAVSSTPVSSEVSSAPVWYGLPEKSPSSRTSSGPIYYTNGDTLPERRVTNVYDDNGKIIGVSLPDGRYISEEEYRELPWEYYTNTIGREAVLPDGTTIIDPFATKPESPSAVSSESED